MPYLTLTFSPFSFAFLSLTGWRRTTLAIALTTSLLGCDAAPLVGRGRPTTIVRLAEREQSDRSLLIVGTVVRQVPLVDGMAYLLEDATGTMWVRTATPLVEMETVGQVRVRGTLSVLETGERVLLEKSREAIIPEPEETEPKDTEPEETNPEEGSAVEEP